MDAIVVGLAPFAAIEVVQHILSRILGSVHLLLELGHDHHLHLPSLLSRLNEQFRYLLQRPFQLPLFPSALILQTFHHSTVATGPLWVLAVVDLV